MHQSVLLHESLDALELRSGDVLVDGTLGRAGHSLEAIKRVPTLFVVGIDRDEDALTESRVKLEAVKANFQLFKGNFDGIETFLKEAGKDGANKIILDLGVSSPHLDSSGRGFSFRSNEPLVMTMEKNPGEEVFTARDIVNNWAEEDIANVIYAYGEERYARRIARRIVEERENSLIETTFDLVRVIESAVPGMYKKGKIHPATRTFQALRIAVNDELGSLRRGLVRAFDTLKPEGRIAVISFHSLEDRIVKIAMKEWEKDGLGKSFTKKPVEPSEEERTRNPRSRSAKLRVFIKN